MQGIQKQFNRNWRNEAIYYWKLWLQQRKMVHYLRKQNRDLRKVLYYKLKD